jgi:O-antigen/teichoic acid export membrane protein
MSKGVRGRLVRGLGANAFGNILTVGIQLLSVPIFLKFWGTQVYGEWLVLSAIPSYLAMSDLGFGSVAATQMTIQVAQHDREGALRTFQSAWTFITLISLLLALVTWLTVWTLPFARWFKLATLSHHQASLIIMLWVIYILVVLQSGLIAAGFRCSGAYAVGVLYGNFIRAVEVAALLFVVALGASPLVAVSTNLLARIVMTAFFATRMKKQVPWLSFGIHHASRQRIKELAGPAFAFMAIPLGLALSLQGMVAAVGVLLGPVAVVAFSVTRTLSRVAFQMMGIVNNAIWPEMSAAYGARNIELARRLHRAACQTLVWLMLPSLIVLAISGHWIIRVWTHSHVPFEAGLFHVLLVVVLVNSLWYTSAVVLIGSNTHQRMALLFLGTTAGSFLLAWAFLPRLGLVAVPCALLVSDLIMTPYVIKQSLELTKDSVRPFLAALASPPKISWVLRRASLSVVSAEGL